MLVVIVFPVADGGMAMVETPAAIVVVEVEEEQSLTVKEGQNAFFKKLDEDPLWAL